MKKFISSNICGFLVITSTLLPNFIFASFDLNEYLVDEILFLESTLHEKEYFDININNQNFEYGYLVGKRDACTEIYKILEAHDQQNFNQIENNY